MKKQYIIPNIEISQVSLNRSILEAGDPSIQMLGGSVQRFGISMDSNQSDFDEEEGWALPANSSLWDE